MFTSTVIKIAIGFALLVFAWNFISEYGAISFFIFVILCTIAACLVSFFYGAFMKATNRWSKHPYA